MLTFLNMFCFKRIKKNVTDESRRLYKNDDGVYYTTTCIYMIIIMNESINK